MIYNFEGIKNVRDLGGIKTADSRTIKGELLFRTAHLHNATKNDLRRLESFGIKEIFDFRDEFETKKEPDKRVKGANNHNIPALSPLPPFDELDGEELKKIMSNSIEYIFKQIYKDLAESEVSRNAYKRFFRIIISSGGAPVLWHCTQGKDRTGIAAILLLVSLGVSESDALDEYFITNMVMQSEYNSFINSGADSVRAEEFRQIMFVHKECISVFLDSVRENFGSVLGFVKGALEVADEEIADLKKWYLD